MKILSKIILLSVALASMVTCTNVDVLPVKNDVPQATFDREQSSISVTVHEPVTLKATVTTEGRVTSRWYVDDALEGSALNFSYIFIQPGVYKIKYVASNNAGEFSKEFTVTVSDILNVQLSTGDSTSIKRKQLEELILMAIVESGANITHEWKIDGQTVSTDALLHNFILSEVKNFNVTYTGVNAVGRVSKSLTVEVIERPLEITFSNNDENINLTKGDVLNITANVLYGGTGVVHSWKINNNEISNFATLSYTLPETGNFALSYHAVNAAGEEVNRTWTLYVSSGGFIFADFENGVKPSNFTTSNSPGLTVVDNPNKSGINTSSKVLKDAVSGTGSTSGFFDFDLSQIPNLSQYTGFRVKIYRIAGNNYFPYIKFGSTGNNIAPVTMPVKFGEWETIEFIFDKSTYTKHQLRPLSDNTGANITTVGDRTILMDDFELIK
jgi:hypothetical protein